MADAKPVEYNFSPFSPFQQVIFTQKDKKSGPEWFTFRFYFIPLHTLFKH